MAVFLINDSVTLTLLTMLILVLTYYMFVFFCLHFPWWSLCRIHSCYCSYNLFRNNIFQQIGMPAPIPIPFLGEFFNIFRKVCPSIWFSHRWRCFHLCYVRVCTKTIWILLKNMVKSSGRSSCRWNLHLARLEISFSRVYEAQSPTILLSDLELLRKVLIKDLHIFMNRRVNHLKKSTYLSIDISLGRRFPGLLVHLNTVLLN